jgi:hypothetical protein
VYNTPEGVISPRRAEMRADMGKGESNLQWVTRWVPEHGLFNMACGSTLQPRGCIAGVDMRSGLARLRFVLMTPALSVASPMYAAAVSCIFKMPGGHSPCGIVASHLTAAC